MEYHPLTHRSPFLFLATRAHDAVADDEYAAMLHTARLDPADLVRVRLEQESISGVDVDDWAGIIVGGSPFNLSDPAAAKSATQQRVEREIAALLDTVVAGDIPFFGACYGIGSLAVHQGGVVDRTHGEPVGAVTVSLTDDGRADPVFGAVPARFDAFVGHKEAVAVVPPTARVLASSPACPVQALRVGRHVYATQYHPELQADGLCLRVDTYLHEGYFDPASAEAVKAEARAATVPEAGAALARFVELHRR